MTHAGPRTGFPFVTRKNAEDGKPIEVWNGATFFGSSPSKSQSSLVSVIGSGTPRPVGMTRGQLALLYWRAKKLKVAGYQSTLNQRQYYLNKTLDVADVASEVDLVKRQSHFRSILENGKGPPDNSMIEVMLRGTKTNVPGDKETDFSDYTFSVFEVDGLLYPLVTISGEDGQLSQQGGAYGGFFTSSITTTGGTKIGQVDFYGAKIDLFAYYAPGVLSFGFDLEVEEFWPHDGKWDSRAGNPL